MDELDLFRDFRSGVASPGDAAQRRASARLAGAVDETTPAMGLLRFITQRPRYSALALAALAGATAAALFVSTPWNSSPGFLARAQAALAEDPGTILHAKWEETWTSSDPACTVVRGPNEIWVDQAPPHRLRAVMEKPTSRDAPPAGRTIVCAPGTRVELHGSAPRGYKFSAAFPGDPVQALREAINAGRAHDEGETQLDGRTVRRIRLDRPAECGDPCLYSDVVYVDPESFHPVEEHGFMAIRSIPAGSQASPSEVRFRLVSGYQTFEYLPRTGANLALVRAP